MVKNMYMHLYVTNNSQADRWSTLVLNERQTCLTWI